MEAHGGRGGTAPTHTLTSALDGGEWFWVTVGRFIHDHNFLNVLKLVLFRSLKAYILDNSIPEYNKQHNIRLVGIT
jgi:hypothetical protein